MLQQNGLEHLCPVLDNSSLTVASAYALFDESRIELLSALKATCISRLAERQGVANALGRARRREELERARDAMRRQLQHAEQQRAHSGHEEQPPLPQPTTAPGTGTETGTSTA